MSPWYYDEEDRKRLDRRGIYEGGGLDCGNDWDEDGDNWDDDDWDDEDDIHECARVHAPNPWKEGVWVSAQPDMYPKGFTAKELNDVYWELSRGDGLDKLLEAASFEEFDEYYNPGTEDVDPAFITEAIVIKKFARTEAVMRRGLVKALRRFLDAKDPTTGTPIELLDPIVGKPRKSGMFAYVTVQLPFSDGQVVSILFHAPEGDGRRITPQDTIVAFRWMLNKRDITNIVAPEDGTEVSIATIGRRLSLLVEKNAPRFAATQKEAQAERRELERVTDRVKELQEEIDRISDEIAQAMADLETATAENGNSKALLQRLKTTNAELRAKLDALQKAKADAEREERKAGGQKPTETETGDTEVTTGTGDKPTSTESEDTPTPEETTTETNPGKTPAFVADLNDILAGRYDNDFPKLEELLDAAVEEVESGDEEAAKYGQLAVQADDRYTELLEEDAADNKEAA